MGSQYAIFDCSQFVTFDTSKPKYEKKLRRDLSNLGFKAIKRKKEMESVKLNYGKEEWHEYVLEMVDEEYMGNLGFDEWPEIEEVPNAIKKLVDVLREYVDNEWVDNLALIFIDYASEDINDDEVDREKAASHEILDVLYEHQYDQVLIMNIVKS
ncbi:hypothetical protein [Marininema halotolerans]|uniref:Uncharacterized protein n=1 Tax=Marininema halotolerans TaxID=1155944 RepID=A0A1I6UM68_9BACL|nr:hypothetical protein [Marininema halotolerans]SFT02576.1 hypothetical protein SAMN05444972_11825 [Marininema halotolerans]